MLILKPVSSKKRSRERLKFSTVDNKKESNFITFLAETKVKEELNWWTCYCDLSNYLGSSNDLQHGDHYYLQ